MIIYCFAQTTATRGCAILCFSNEADSEVCLDTGYHGHRICTTTDHVASLSIVRNY